MLKPNRVRDGINGWFDRHEVMWECLMALLALVFVVTAFLPRDPTIRALDIGISVLFVGEFAVRIAAARSRSHYLLHHWMDVVALVPAIPGYEDASTARIVRVLRLLMILRLLGAMDRILHHVKGVTAQPGLTYLIGLIAIMVVGIAGINHLIEKNTNEGFDSYSKALYWAMVTVTTTGYGDIAPRTEMGRAMATMLMVGGLVLWSLLTASVINYIAGIAASRKHHSDKAIEEMKAKLDRLDSLSRDELVSFRGSVDALVESRLGAGSNGRSQEKTEAKGKV